MPYAIKLYPNGRVEKVTKPDDMDMLDFIYRECECDLFEPVYSGRLHEGYFMAVNEEGLLDDRPQLNPLASWLYGFDIHLQPIVGPVLILKMAETPDGGESELLDDQEADVLMAWLNERKLVMTRDVLTALIDSQPCVEVE